VPWLREPLLCLVTDRRRLAGEDRLSIDRACARLIEQTRAAVETGIDLVQVREPDLEGRDLARLVRALVALTSGSSTRLVVNERLDVALACGADGVHLRGHSIPAAEVRRLAPEGFLVGRSVHTVDDLAGVGPVDYLVAGSVFASVSKPHEERLLGPSGLGKIVAGDRRRCGPGACAGDWRRDPTERGRDCARRGEWRGGHRALPRCAVVEGRE
jgi:thiamine-phosphate pyrophosphorylase